MTKARACAINDAETHYEQRRRSDAQWLQFCADVRAGTTFGPSTTVMVALGSNADSIADAWGLSDVGQISVAAREYDSAYLAAIEVLIRRAHEGRTT